MRKRTCPGSLTQHEAGPLGASLSRSKSFSDKFTGRRCRALGKFEGSAGGQAADPRGAFSLLELIIVVSILGILFAISIPSLEGIVPKYRLRSAARTLASELEFVRLSAISRERWMGLRYVLDPVNADLLPYYQVIPPPPDDDPFQPIEERELQTPKELPTAVRFARVILPSGRVVDSGAINILFSPEGNTGSHAVVLETPEERYASLKFNCITGVLEFAESEEVGFGRFEE